jgi:hypothetical protein
VIDCMNNKIEFLTKELFILAWAASVQRAKLYVEKTDLDHVTKTVTKFREDIIKFLTEKIIPQYVKGCTEERHYENIEALIAFANEVGSGVLGAAGYKYGVAQKLLNLALKYYWCLDLICEPPHCPIDRIIIGKTIHNGKINWTQITKRSQYEEVINEVKALADTKGLSIPQWELTYYSRR